MDREGMVDVVYLDLRKASDMIFYKVFVTNLLIGGFSRWTARWVENCWDCCAQRAKTRSSWWPVVFLAC